MIIRKIATFFFVLTSMYSSGQDFRQTTWGMSPEQVQEKETAELLSENSELLIYRTQLAEFEAMVAYIFADNQLVRAKYVILEEHSNKNDFIRDYEVIQGILEKKYQIPLKNERIWRNDLYKDNYSDWGFAVSLGHFLLYSSWETDQTGITLILSGDNYEIETVIEYRSTLLGSLERELLKEKELGAFSSEGFRNNFWGDSKARVKQKESFNLVSEDSGFLMYEGRVAGLKVYIGFLFEGEKLVLGKYLVDEDHSNLNDYIADYDNLKDVLQQAYGQPYEEKTLWKNDLYQDDFSDWGFAVSLGHLVYYASFSNDWSETTIMLNGDNYEVNLIVESRSKEFKSIEEEGFLDDF